MTSIVQPFPRPRPGVQHFGQISVTPFGQQPISKIVSGPMIPGRAINAKTYEDAVKAVQSLSLVDGSHYVALSQAEEGVFRVTPLHFDEGFVHLLNSKSATNVQLWSDHSSFEGIVGNFRDYEAKLRYTYMPNYVDVN